MQKPEHDAQNDLSEAKRIMERLVKSPPKPHDSDKQDKSQEKKEKPDD
ncbi:hypothetical protein [Mesorhizobium sp. LNJC403B00]|nr:hypothetical protein [Mesorhizobium sp. LNJC403B00]ESX87055.1 hypothetical protein X754_28650 [Mesorhizobium sp. LNJC403B00]